MVLILAGFTAQYAAAESFNQEDMAFAFGDSAVVASDFGQMDLLSSQEMAATEGEYLWYLAGAGVGMLAYGSSCIYTSCTARGFGYAAATGAFAPVRTAQAFYHTSRLAFYGGTGWGIGSRYSWW